MPDLTFVAMQQCKSLNRVMVKSKCGKYDIFLGNERHWPQCSCPAYKYGVHGKTNFEGRMAPNPCKHIKEYEESICGWHQQFDEPQTGYQKKNHICPRCGGETVTVAAGA